MRCPQCESKRRMRTCEDCGKEFNQNIYPNYDIQGLYSESIAISKLSTPFWKGDKQ